MLHHEGFCAADPTDAALLVAEVCVSVQSKTAYCVLVINNVKQLFLYPELGAECATQMYIYGTF